MELIVLTLFLCFVISGLAFIVFNVARSYMRCKTLNSEALKLLMEHADIDASPEGKGSKAVQHSAWRIKRDDIIRKRNRLDNLLKSYAD